MTYDVHVTGRSTPMRFVSYRTAEAYRAAIAAGTGRAAWIRASR